MVFTHGNKNNNRVLRAALFERVSTDEQKKFGFSIAAQKDMLEEYCQTNKIKVVDHYCDEGVSGGISYKKRPEMVRLLKDVEAGKIDIILFSKLDRWFRSVKEYYLVQEILDRHNVEWRSITEDYSTDTANGQLSITIFLAIAENERAKTAERIRTVFEHKRKNKEAFFGKASVPFGYIEKPDKDGIKRLVKDPELEHVLTEFFNLCIKYDSITAAAKTINMKYGLTKGRNKWHELTKKEIYTGNYKGVEDYCPAYIQYEDWLKLQNKSKVRQTKDNRIYLFTGLIECPVCGNNLRSKYCVQTRKSGKVKEYYSYKCAGRDSRTCSYTNAISQMKTETWLLDNLNTLLQDEIARVEIEKAKPKPKPKVDTQALKERLRRLDVIFMAGNIGDEEYLTQQKELKNAIQKAEDENDNAIDKIDVSNLKDILETDFKSIYQTLDDKDKRRFWRQLIKRIHVEGNDIVSVEFN